MDGKATLVQGIGNVMSTLLLGQTKQTIVRIDQRLQSVEKTVDEIKVNQGVSPHELRSRSPLTLTQYGQKLIKRIGFDKVFTEHITDFFQYIDDQEPKLKYDVELAAIRSLAVFKDRDYMAFLKVYFYNNPQRNIANLAPTLGVYIRDKYLKEHPEIAE